MNKDNVTVLIDLARTNENPEIRYSAIHTIVKRSDTPIEWIEEALDDPCVSIRRSVAAEMIKREDLTLSCIEKAFNDSDSCVRAFIVRTFATRDVPEEWMLKALKDPSNIVVLRAVEAYKGFNTIPTELTKLVLDPKTEDDIRMAAMDILLDIYTENEKETDENGESV